MSNDDIKIANDIGFYNKWNYGLMAEYYSEFSDKHNFKILKTGNYVKDLSNKVNQILLTYYSKKIPYKRIIIFAVKSINPDLMTPELLYRISNCHYTSLFNEYRIYISKHVLIDNLRKDNQFYNFCFEEEMKFRKNIDKSRASLATDLKEKLKVYKNSDAGIYPLTSKYTIIDLLYKTLRKEVIEYYNSYVDTKLPSVTQIQNDKLFNDFN